MMGATLRIGVDLGGTKIEAVALQADGRERWRQRVPTPAGSYEETVAAVASLVRAAPRASGEAVTVGVGTPGSADPVSGLHRNANSTCLNGRPLRQDLERALGMAVAAANDANCFALSEAVDGAGAGAKCVFGVILGTGCGGGVVVDAHALDGANLVAGEWGHLRMPGVGDRDPEAVPCYCGRTGCVETFLSGPALEARYRRMKGSHAALPEVEARRAAGEPEARELMAWYAAALGRALSLVVHVVDPDAIVLGGGVSNLPWLAEALPAAISPWVFGGVFRTPVRRALHGDSSGVRGAAWLPALSRSGPRP